MILMDWHPHIFELVTWPHVWDWFAQVTAPTPTPTAVPTPAAPPTTATADEVALLKSQIELLQKAYGTLDTTFQRYITLVQTALTVAGIGVGVVCYWRGDLAVSQQYARFSPNPARGQC